MGTLSVLRLDAGGGEGKNGDDGKKSIRLHGDILLVAVTGGHSGRGVEPEKTYRRDSTI